MSAMLRMAGNDSLVPTIVHRNNRHRRYLY